MKIPERFKPYMRYFPAAIGVAGLILAGVLFLNRTQSPAGPDSEKAGQTSTVKNELAVVGTVEEIYAACEGKPAPSDIFECYAATFDVYMRANGGRMTLTLLDDLQKKGGYVQSNCHPLSHKVGNIALHVYGTVPKAVPEYLPVCHSGYYHGLLEEYLGTAPDYDTGLREVCGTTQTQAYFNWFQCMHGLGHGIMQFKDNEVPESLKDCDKVPPENQGPEICYAGVFMENITTDEKTGHPAKYIRKDDPIYPCNSVEEKYKSACYFLASSQILKINGWDFPKTAKACAEDAEEKYRWLCFQSYGRDVSGSTKRDQSRVKELCGLATAYADKSDCYFGAVRDFINEKGEFGSAVPLCNFIESDFRQKCYDAIFLDMGNYKTGQAFVDVCATMPEPYRQQCIVRPH